MRLLLALAAVLAVCALFVRSYTVPPAPDRQGGTIVSLTWPNRSPFGSPRGDCLATPAAELPIACLIASVARSRAEGIPLMSFGFCPTCYDLSVRIARLGHDPAAIEAKSAQISRFGW
ncbi:hypothetical protein ASG40_14445 [Methylobacterium sp. Leaf399]|uniref:hypothetical protein n=1 Tax=Methylobacterium sp. Leaf399 TaxID=1736364 RepID=UPI0006F7368A|nr:hypothetical protein [Methylobacterium sp. Leaf399]KQT07515.1 hypothetical protein ASG40_14445 [Methylobacterium sp. Leaf399]